MKRKNRFQDEFDIFLKSEFFVLQSAVGTAPVLKSGETSQLNFHKAASAAPKAYTECVKRTNVILCKGQFLQAWEKRDVQK